MQGTRNQWEGATQNLGLNFNIEWQRRYELPFQETESLRNPLNEDKPVKISRDGQELPPDIGEALVQLFEEGAERTGVPRPGDMIFLASSKIALRIAHEQRAIPCLRQCVAIASDAGHCQPLQVLTVFCSTPITCISLLV